MKTVFADFTGRFTRRGTPTNKDYKINTGGVLFL